MVELVHVVPPLVRVVLGDNLLPYLLLHDVPTRSGFPTVVVDRAVLPVGDTVLGFAEVTIECVGDHLEVYKRLKLGIVLCEVADKVVSHTVVCIKVHSLDSVQMVMFTFYVLAVSNVMRRVTWLCSLVRLMRRSPSLSEIRTEGMLIKYPR